MKYKVEVRRGSGRGAPIWICVMQGKRIEHPLRASGDLPERIEVMVNEIYRQGVKDGREKANDLRRKPK